ncbi:MAG TPA: hypothetical protein VM818_16455 [Vicinamibacterales bacterium]|nr:hypothetical protein [Vicinamibacterales bacterium]
MSVRPFAGNVLITAALAVAGCASTSSVRWNPTLDPFKAPASGPVFVMEPMVEGTASPGNVGRNFPAGRQEVLARVLSILREQSAAVDVAGGASHGRNRALASYPAAVGGGGLTTEELDAANAAFENGAAELLVPTILEWTEMRTDDPIGIFTTAHNRIAIDLRLMRLRPPGLAAHAVFRNRARLTLNQSAARLLDDNFRIVVLKMVSGRN